MSGWAEPGSVGEGLSPLDGAQNRAIALLCQKASSGDLGVWEDPELQIQVSLER